MRKVFTASNSAEAHMVQGCLAEGGIESSIQGEHTAVHFAQPVTVWIMKDEDEERAKTIISEVLNSIPQEHENSPVSPTRLTSATSFVGGLIVGCILGCALGVGFYYLSNPEREYSMASDSNNDGEPDAWWEYSDGALIKQPVDANFDGRADSWHYFERGLIDRSYIDNDLDGEAEHCEYYKKGQPFKYTVDNDRDGTVDEWGRISGGIVSESNWSYNNDDIVDKRARYKHGRKITEEYDRDRDGAFDEMVFLDKFERVVKVEKTPKTDQKLKKTPANEPRSTQR